MRLVVVMIIKVKTTTVVIKLNAITATDATDLLELW